MQTKKALHAFLQAKGLSDDQAVIATAILDVIREIDQYESSEEALDVCKGFCAGFDAPPVVLCAGTSKVFQ